MELLHLFAQRYQHGDACILGNRSGLIALRNAITQALDSSDGAGATEAMTTDGEGYTTFVVLNEKPWKDETWDGMQLPYRLEGVPEDRQSRFGPFDLLSESVYRRLSEQARAEAQQRYDANAERAPSDAPR